MSRGIRSARPVLRAWRRIPGPPRDPVKARLLRLYRALLAHHGPQGWWPARTPFEVAVGAILTQHTAWTRRRPGRRRAARPWPARCRTAGGHAGCRRSSRSSAPPGPSGSRRAGCSTSRAGCSRASAAISAPCAARRSDPLRREVLAVPGLGPETADAILLYAAGRPVFVADAYTRRVLARHRLMSGRSRVRGCARVARSAPAFGSRALQRAPRAAGGRRQDRIAAPYRTARPVRCDSTSAAGRRRPCAAEGHRRRAHAPISSSRSTSRSAASGMARARARSPMSLRRAGSPSSRCTWASRTAGVQLGLGQDRAAAGAGHEPGVGGLLVAAGAGQGDVERRHAQMAALVHRARRPRG